VKTFQDIKYAYEAASHPAQRMDNVTAFLKHKVDEIGQAERFLVSILMHDSDPIVRHEAAFVLGDFRSTGLIDDGVGSVALCNAARNDRSAVVRHEAIEALQWFSGPEVDATLAWGLKDEVEDVRLTAAISLAKRDASLTQN
jgi:HEAT repeat protein